MKNLNSLTYKELEVLQTGFLSDWWNVSFAELLRERSAFFTNSLIRENNEELRGMIKMIHEILDLPDTVSDLMKNMKQSG